LEEVVGLGAERPTVRCIPIIPTRHGLTRSFTEG
jgi:hypothetical protein